MITQRIEVYLSKHSPTKSIHMVQNDTGRMLSMEVIDETITSGSTAKLYFLRPNESLYYSDCTISGNTAICDVTQALTQCGAVHCTLTFYTSGKSISAYAFDILVEKNNSEGPLTPEERESLVDKMENYNPVGSGSFSMNRLPGSSVGDESSTLNHNNSASGHYSNAENYYTAAGSSRSHAEGDHTIAGNASSRWGLHAEGYYSNAYGDYGAHAEGYKTEASGYYGSHSEGHTTVSSGEASHAEGTYTIASGEASHAEGEGTAANKSNASGVASHVEGMQTKADANASHAEGYMSEAHANASHAECNRAKVYSENGHAEGFKCEVGSSSDTTKSMANSGHAEGRETKALGYASHSEGRGTIAEGAEQHVQGRFNVKDTTSAFIIGNGTDDTHRSNAMKVAFDGTLTIGSVSITPAQLQALLNLL